MDPIIWISALTVIVMVLTWRYGPKAQLIEVDPEVPRWRWKSKWHWKSTGFATAVWKYIPPTIFVLSVINSAFGLDPEFLIPLHDPSIGDLVITVVILGISYIKLKGY